MLYLTKSQAEELWSHLYAELPNEACGILAGKGERVHRVYKMDNVDKSPVSFFMEPRQQLAVMKEIRNLGLEFIGIYHTHPNTSPYPSAKDLELAFYPDVSYVIISGKDKVESRIRSFKIKDGKIAEEKVYIVEDE